MKTKKFGDFPLTIIVKGPPGSGKSTLLTLIYKTLEANKWGRGYSKENENTLRAALPPQPTCHTCHQKLPKR